jgi:hypothetical protein
MPSQRGSIRTLADEEAKAPRISEEVGFPSTRQT